MEQGPRSRVSLRGPTEKAHFTDCPPHDMLSVGFSLTVVEGTVQRGRKDLAFHLANHSGAARGRLADASEVRSGGVNERRKDHNTSFLDQFLGSV